MNNNYKAIVSNKELYTEIELQQDEQFVRVGTVPGCNVRLNRKQFFSDFWICFSNTGDTWRISCSENIYVYAGDVRKLTNKLLQNGETISIRYQESNASLFFIEFVVDFNNEQRKYQRVIDIRNNALISIGTDYSNHIALRSIYAPNENVILKKTQNGYELNPLKATYGVYLNGSKINQNTLVKDTDFFSIADFIFYYRNGLLWTEVRKDIQINGIAYWDCSDMNSYPRFVRNTREKIEVNTEKIEVLDPPNKPSKPRNHILTSLLPSMGMLATSGMMATMGRSMIAYSIVSGGMSIVLAVATLIQNNADYKKDLLKREEQYHAYEARKRNEINTLRENERAELELIYTDSAELERRIDEFSRDLFDRMPDDKDFLDVRLGLGTVKALREIEVKKQERIETDDDLCEIPHQIAEDFKLLDEIPVVCHLKEANAIGIIGAEVYRYEMMKNILYDLCTRQYLDDIALFFIAKPEHASRIEKLRNLPQVNNPKVGFRCIAYEDEGKNRVFDTLFVKVDVSDIA